MKFSTVVVIWAAAWLSGESAAQESAVLLDAAHRNVVQPAACVRGA